MTKWVDGTEQTKRVHYVRVCCRYKKQPDSFWFTAYWDFSKKMWATVNNNIHAFIAPADIQFLCEEVLKRKGGRKKIPIFNRPLG